MLYYSFVNPPRCTPDDYIDFLVASPGPVSCTEAARVQPEGPFAPAHDSFNRLLNRLEPDPEGLWAEAEPLVEKARGALVIDDSTLDKAQAQQSCHQGPFEGTLGRHRGSSWCLGPLVAKLVAEVRGFATEIRDTETPQNPGDAAESRNSRLLRHMALGARYGRSKSPNGPW